jgi:N-hydroxyarylamine O-acetyltransferase
VRGELVHAVIERFGIGRPEPDLQGLRSLYAAWCGSVPHENTRKLIHLGAGLGPPLPGSTAEDFFDGWLADGTGGTCWAANGALHDLLAALGFGVERAIATMLSAPDVAGPNHGSVVVEVAGERWVADASILSGEPIRIPRGGTTPAEDSPLPRFERLDGKPAVRWRALNAPDGFFCRFERIGATREEWDCLHQRTATWSPFNSMLNARLLRRGESIGAARGQRFVFRADGSHEATPLEGDARARFLTEDLGISPAVAERVPPDRPVPPRPV